jgi:DNA processing protein
MSETGDLTETQGFLVLNALPNIGPVPLNRLLAAFGGDPRAVLSATRRQLEGIEGIRGATVATVVRWRDHFDLAREEGLMRASGVEFLPMRGRGYPNLLLQIADPPVGLYRKGPCPLDRPCIAVVGSRRHTLYGQAVARRLGAELAGAGFCVVSGLARGIDTAAHEGALGAEGRTVGVIGSGPDIVYPPENRALYRRIEASGAILSEFPFGCAPQRHSFPMRNRIVSGMCHAVVVVESDVDGGAMITARFAGEQGRTVFAVPGRIDQRTSAGCHQLIRDGASLLTCADDIVSELNYLDGLRPGPIPEKRDRVSARRDLSADERAVLEPFRGGGILSRDALAAQTGLSPGELSATVMMLEIKGLIAKRLDGAYEAMPTPKGAGLGTKADRT